LHLTAVINPELDELNREIAVRQRRTEDQQVLIEVLDDHHILEQEITLDRERSKACPTTPTVTSSFGVDADEKLAAFVRLGLTSTGGLAREPFNVANAAQKRMLNKLKAFSTTPKPETAASVSRSSRPKLSFAECAERVSDGSPKSSQASPAEAHASY
jgi:hypothetical protein